MTDSQQGQHLSVIRDLLTRLHHKRHDDKVRYMRLAAYAASSEPADFAPFKELLEKCKAKDRASIVMDALVNSQCPNVLDFARRCKVAGVRGLDALPDIQIDGDGKVTLPLLGRSGQPTKAHYPKDKKYAHYTQPGATKTVVLVTGNDSNGALDSTKRVQYLLSKGYNVIALDGRYQHISQKDIDSLSEIDIGGTEVSDIIMDAHGTMLGTAGHFIAISDDVSQIDRKKVQFLRQYDGLRAATSFPHAQFRQWLGKQSQSLYSTSDILKKIKGAFNITKPVNVMSIACYGGGMGRTVDSDTLPAGSQIFTLSDEKSETMMPSATTERIADKACSARRSDGSESLSVAQELFYEYMQHGTFPKPCIIDVTQDIVLQTSQASHKFALTRYCDSKVKSMNLRMPSSLFSDDFITWIRDLCPQIDETTDIHNVIAKMHVYDDFFLNKSIPQQEKQIAAIILHSHDQYIKTQRTVSTEATLVQNIKIAHILLNASSCIKRLLLRPDSLEEATKYQKKIQELVNIGSLTGNLERYARQITSLDLRADDALDKLKLLPSSIVQIDDDLGLEYLRSKLPHDIESFCVQLSRRSQSIDKKFLLKVFGQLQEPLTGIDVEGKKVIKKWLYTQLIVLQGQGRDDDARAINEAISYMELGIDLSRQSLRSSSYVFRRKAAFLRSKSWISGLSWVTDTSSKAPLDQLLINSMIHKCAEDIELVASILYESSDGRHAEHQVGEVIDTPALNGSRGLSGATRADVSKFLESIDIQSPQIYSSLSEIFEHHSCKNVIIVFTKDQLCSTTLVQPSESSDSTLVIKLPEEYKDRGGEIADYVATSGVMRFASYDYTAQYDTSYVEADSRFRGASFEHTHCVRRMQDKSNPKAVAETVENLFENFFYDQKKTIWHFLHI